MKRFMFPALIVFLSLFIAFQNYVPGTTLSGWDNLHPEFNWSANFTRSVSTVWQEYQGLGLLGGMGTGADLPRQLILFLASFVFQTSFIRYLWHFAMLAVGPLGVYYLSLFFTKNKFGSALGSIFYLLNLATVQYFFVPFESFSAFYGLFPWLIFYLLNYLKSPNKQNLLKLSLITFLAATAFYVQTLFVVYAMVIALFIFEYYLKSPKKHFRISRKTTLVILAINSFWLLPVIYFSFRGSHVLLTAKTSVLPTEETLLMNQGFGDLKNITLLKGFWFEYLDADLGVQNFNYLLPEWREYTGAFEFQAVGYLLFILSFVGVLLHAANKKSKYRFAILGGFLLCILMLTGGVGILGILFSILTKSVPFFGQIFRSTFTKWSSAAALFYALGLGLFIHHIKKFNKLLSFLLIVLIIWQMKPVFGGNLISPTMRLKMPQEYTALFDYFKREPKQVRIAKLPAHTIWGWDFYNWGYRGSGFLWYGIEQPILDRAFDIWSSQNETFYHQIARATNSDSAREFAAVFKKYDVSYVLVDHSVTTTQSSNTEVNFEHVENLLHQIGATVAWEKGSLTVYKLPNYSTSFVSAKNNYSEVSNQNIYNREDIIYSTLGDYIKAPAVTFPFSDLSQEATQGISYENQNSLTYLTLSRSLSSQENADYELVLPPLPTNFPYTAVAKVSYDGKLVEVKLEQPINLKLDGKPISIKPILPSLLIGTDKEYQNLFVSVGGKVVSVSKNGKEAVTSTTIFVDQPFTVEVFDKDNGVETDLSTSFATNQYNLCWQREGQEPVYNIIQNQAKLAITTKDAVACAAYKLRNTNSSRALISVSLPYQSPDGAKPHFCLVEEGSGDCLNDEVFYHTPTSKLPSFVVRNTAVNGGKNYWLVVSARPPEETGQTWTINYEPPSISSYPVIASIDFNDVVWQRLKSGLSLPISGSPKTIKLTLPSTPETFDFGEVGRQTAYNCDYFKRGEITKSISNDTVAYSAQNRGAYCDFALLRKISTQYDYILRLQGKNQSGRSLKFFLYNPSTQKSDLEYILDKNNFDQSFNILSWPNLKESEYTLNLETRSFGGELSQNSLKPVEIYQLPLSWLQNWEVKPVNYEPQSGNLKIVSEQKTGTALYQVKTEGSGLLTLSQAYEGGWVAFTGEGKVLKHTEVNGWKNGWLVDSSLNHQSLTIYIVYWPQLLQYLGFLLLPLTVILILKD